MAIQQGTFHLRNYKRKKSLNSFFKRSHVKYEVEDSLHTPSALSTLPEEEWVNMIILLYFEL